MNQMLPIGQTEPKLSTAVALALVVTERRPVAEGIEEFTFASADGAPLPPWKPGGHVEFVLQLGGGAAKRCYSLLGEPHDGSKLAHCRVETAGRARRLGLDA
jgi:ferredoxin-NADP reductase